jgi:hypothetical protein
MLLKLTKNFDRFFLLTLDIVSCRDNFIYDDRRTHVFVVKILEHFKIKFLFQNLLSQIPLHSRRVSSY